MNHIAAKASRVLNFLKRNFKQVPADLKETLYMTNVRPILEYGCATWDPDAKTLISELKNVRQGLCPQTMTSPKAPLRCAKIARETQVLTAEAVSQYFCRCNRFDKRYIYKRTQLYILPFRPSFISSNQCCINIFKNSFFPKTVHDWNKLPEEIVLAPPPSFENTLSRFLLN